MRAFGRSYDTGQKVCLDISAGQIARVTACSPIQDAETQRDRTQRSGKPWPWIAPGLIDIQVNGYGGQEFSSADLTVEKVDRIARQMDAFGVTRFCPTITTGRLDVLRHALKTIAEACDASVATARRIAGIHLEGPYVSPLDGPRGAHPREHCRVPDMDEFQRLQDAARGRIRILTLSVEFEAAARFVEQVSRSGVVVGIGHTAADSDAIRAAVDAGARLSTHLGNGAHAMLPRHPNYIWDQLAEDRLTAGLIVDGHHLPPAVVKTLVRAKTPARCLLVSDMAGQAGLAPGRYEGGLCDVEILPTGRLVIAGQTQLLAGATMPIGTGVTNVMRFADVGLSDAVAMATERPAELLEIAPGRLEPDKPADLVLFSTDPEFQVQATILGGDVVFGALPDLTGAD